MLKNEPKQIQINNLCFSYDKFRDLIEDSEINDKVFFLNVESMNLWEGTKHEKYIYITVKRDQLEVYLLIHKIWGKDDIDLLKAFYFGGVEYGS